jgi:cytoskeletal protein RodZ
VADDVEPEVESDLRRRAAWLLGMLVIVAVLFVVVMSKVIGTDSGSKNASDNGPRPLDGASASTGPQSSASTSSSASSSSASSTSPASRTSSSTAPHKASCPTSARCALDDDIGDAVAAVNAYRTQHGKIAVPGTVSEEAKTCALNNGNGCSGGWAESQVPGPDGDAAVDKIVAFGKLLDPAMKSFGVGWAYDPGSKSFFFAIVRND